MNAAATHLAAFQRDFAAALWSEDASAHPLAAQPGFAVYRNTVFKGCIDALEANYPAVARLVGSEWFRSAAALYVRTAPPRDACLARYGDGFADFLQSFEPAAGLPYLPAVARLDRCWTESHLAADAAPASADWLAQLSPQQLGAVTLRPHPAARWVWFDALPAFSIWRCNREPGAATVHDEELVWQGEGALVTRPALEVGWCALGPGGSALLDACADGAPLGAAAGAALSAEPGVELAPLLSRLLQRGALAAPDERMLPS